MSYKIKFEVEGYKCLRCGHKWIPRSVTASEPTICPTCKSPYWNRLRRTDMPRKGKDTKKLKELQKYR